MLLKRSSLCHHAKFQSEVQVLCHWLIQAIELRYVHVTILFWFAAGIETIKYNDTYITRVCQFSWVSTTFQPSMFNGSNECLLCRIMIIFVHSYDIHTFVFIQTYFQLRYLQSKPSQVIFYERDDEIGPKMSNYHIATTDNPNSLMDVLSSALGQKGTINS